MFSLNIQFKCSVYIRVHISVSVYQLQEYNADILHEGEVR